MIVDEKGTTIPKDVQGLLEYVRDNGDKPSSSDTQRIEYTSSPLWRTVSTNTSDSYRVGSEGRQEAYSIPGRDGIESSREGSSTRTAGDTRQEYSSAPRSDSSFHQHSGPTTSSTRSKRQRFYNNVKSIFAPYGKILKSDIVESGNTLPKNKVLVVEKKLTDAEKLGYKEKLVEFFLWTSDHMDEAITATTRGHKPVEIWSSISKDEAELLADYMLNRAKSDPKMAKVVRQIVTFMDKIRVAVIILPRMYATAMYYLQEGFSIR